MNYQLAQLNVARFMKPVAHPDNADFVSSVARVNEIAEAQPGFVWRFAGDADLEAQVFGDQRLAVNMSVWADMESLAAFVYRNEAHVQIMRRRREWFERTNIYQVLWWIETAQIPSLHEAKRRLGVLEANGPTPAAFTFKRPFAPPGGADVKPIFDECA